jgi:hypothetical protein
MGVKSEAERQLMMRSPRRLVVALAVFALVAAGGVTASLAASAVTAQTCSASADVSVATCTIPTQTLLYPAAIQIDIELTTGGAAQDVVVTWHGYCAQGARKAVITSPLNGTTVAVPPTTAVKVPMPYTVPDYCDISTTATLNGTGTLEMTLEWTQGTPASPSAPAGVPLIKGYGGKCLDDKGNSRADRTEVIIWTCNGADSAQGWKFTNGELVHDGRCANDRANGGSGTKVILWTCDRAPDETWTHTGSDGEFVLSSRTHGLLCLDDPGYSTTNRTQLTVSACRNTSNQHWT